MSKKREYSAPPITYTYVAPGEVYMDNYDIPLANSFSTSRYKYDPQLNEYSIRNDKYGTNTGAVQLFNINNNQKITEPKANVSTFIEGENGRPTSFGHSERLGMRDVLNEFIPSNTGIIEKPSSYARSNNKEEQENILLNLIQNAPRYKDYLTSQNAIVKMWSERPPCSSNLASDPSGNCRGFMNTISPEGSKYMYIVSDSKKYNDKDIEDASKTLFNHYLNYKKNPIDYKRNPIARMMNPNEYKRQRISSPNSPPSEDRYQEWLNSPVGSPPADMRYQDRLRSPSKSPVGISSPKEEQLSTDTIDGLTWEEWEELANY